MFSGRYRYAYLYNYHIPQKNLNHKTPITTLKAWKETHPNPFNKRIINHPGPDTYSAVCVALAYQDSFETVKPGSVRRWRFLVGKGADVALLTDNQIGYLPTATFPPRGVLAIQFARHIFHTIPSYRSIGDNILAFQVGNSPFLCHLLHH
jgi:hypothetical protein